MEIGDPYRQLATLVPHEVRDTHRPGGQSPNVLGRCVVERDEIIGYTG